MAKEKDTKDSEAIPKGRLDEEIKKRQQLEEKLKLAEQQMSLMQANAPKQEPPKEEDLFEGLFEDGDNVPDVGQLREIFRRFEGKYRPMLNNIMTMVQYPDYQNIVQTYLPNAIKRNPALQQLLAGAGGNVMQIAYALASYEKELAGKTSTSEQSTPEAQAAVQAALAAADQPGSASAAQSKAAMDYQQQIAKMSGEEILQHADEVASQEPKQGD